MKKIILLCVIFLMILTIGCSDKKTDSDRIVKSVIDTLNSTGGSDILLIYFLDPSKVKAVKIDSISSFVQRGDTAIFSGMITLERTVLPMFSSNVIRNEAFYPFQEQIKRKFNARVVTKDSLPGLLNFSLEHPLILTVANSKQTVDDFFKNNRIKSIKKVPALIAKAKEEFKDAPYQEKDYLFCLIHQRMKELAKPYQYNSRNGDAGWNRFESNIKYGFAIDSDEGYSWLIPDYAYLKKQFSKFISDDQMIFVNVFKLEYESPYCGRDAFLSDIITPLERLKRLIEIEDYFKGNNQTLLQDQMEVLFTNLFIRLFRTYNNSAVGPTLSEIKGMAIGDELKAIFLEAEKKYPESFIGAFAKEYNKVLVKNNYLITDEVISFLSSRKIADANF